MGSTAAGAATCGTAAQSSALTPAGVPVYACLPIALVASVWIIRTFAADARGHGTEAVIAAVHQRSGRVNWMVAPVKLCATVITLAFGNATADAKVLSVRRFCACAQ